MAELMYDRTQIIEKVTLRLAAKQKGVGASPNRITVIRDYFTDPLGSEPISNLLRHIDSSGVAMEMNAAFVRLSSSNKINFVRAVGYGMGGVAFARLNETFLEPWSTRRFIDEANSLFLLKAHLEPMVLDKNPNEEIQNQADRNLSVQDQLVTKRLRDALLPPAGQSKRNIGYFFTSIDNLKALPSLHDLINQTFIPQIKYYFLEAGLSFQATLDAITPTTRLKAIDHLTKWGL